MYTVSKAARIERNKQVVDKIKADTVCVRCGKQPIEYHSDEHLIYPNRRISSMVGQAMSVVAILAEIENCEPLCRGCHMAVDGRATPGDCIVCGVEVKRHRRGRCQTCYTHWRRHGGP